MTNPSSPVFRVADLSQNRPTRFEVNPAAEEMSAIAEQLGLLGLRKLRFTGQIVAEGQRDWRLEAKLGATVVQPCVLSLEPVTTRIDDSIIRRFLAQMPDNEDSEEEEVEMPEDDSIEPLGKMIDPAAVMIEALSLALPLYPRADGAALGDTAFTEPGKEALKDEDLKPFAGLAALRDKLTGDDSAEG